MADDTHDVLHHFKLFQSAVEQQDWVTALSEYRVVYDWYKAVGLDDRLLYRQIMAGLEQKVSERH